METVIQTPTPKLEQSRDFYTRLGFADLSYGDKHYFADGKVLLEINPNRFARAGLKLYRDSWTEEVAALHKITAVQKTEEGYLLADPSGTWIYLLEDQLELDLKSAPPSALGEIAGMSLETLDMPKSAEILTVLGFQQTIGSPEQGWVVYANADGLGVSLMKPHACPHLFFNPSLTYFNGGKNLPVIANIRARGIAITEEITLFNEEGIVDNVIIRDPGGLGFFVFND
jgi:hypothetical protein